MSSTRDKADGVASEAIDRVRGAVKGAANGLPTRSTKSSESAMRAMGEPKGYE
ncbi:hypothetical protein [Alsobacter sp. SYSU BS001988]|jgi:hypothetical protein